VTIWRLFGFLSKEGLLMLSNLPYQQFMDRGLGAEA